MDAQFGPAEIKPQPKPSTSTSTSLSSTVTGFDKPSRLLVVPQPSHQSHPHPPQVGGSDIVNPIQRTPASKNPPKPESVKPQPKSTPQPPSSVSTSTTSKLLVVPETSTLAGDGPRRRVHANPIESIPSQKSNPSGATISLPKPTSISLKPNTATSSDVVQAQKKQQQQQLHPPQHDVGSSSSEQRPIKKRLKAKKKQRRKRRGGSTSSEQSDFGRVTPFTMETMSSEIQSGDVHLQVGGAYDSSSSGFSSHFSETVSTAQVADVDIQIQPPSTLKSRASSRDSLHAAITGKRSDSRSEAAAAIDNAMILSSNSPVSPALSFSTASRLALGVRGIRRKRANSIIGSSAGSHSPYIRKASKQKIREIVDKMNALLSGSEPLTSSQMKTFLNYGLVGAQGSPSAAALFYHKNINFTTLLRCKPDLLSSGFNLPLHRGHDGVGRSGEFFLHAAAHAAEEDMEAKFNMGQCSISQFSECARNPIHALLLQLKYEATNEEVRSDSLSILTEAIEYINSSVWHTGELSSESHQNSNPEPTTRRLSVPPFIWDGSALDSEHVYCRKVPSPEEVDILASAFLPPEICPYCGADRADSEIKPGSPKSKGTGKPKVKQVVHTCPESEAGISFIQCTPVELAVNLRLADVIRSMLGIDKSADRQGLISQTKIIPHSVKGWDSHGRELQESNLRYESFIDVWDFSRQRLKKQPILHDLLVNSKMKHVYLLKNFNKQASPPLDTDVGPIQANSEVPFHTFIPASYSPGSGGDVGVADADDDDEIDYECLQIIEYLIRASSVQRQIKPFAMFHVNSEAEERGEVVTTLFDRCGVFTIFNGVMGVTLLAQRQPLLIRKLFEYDLISRAPYKPHRLNTIVAEGPTWILRQHRHLWRLTGIGSELLIYDCGVTFIHYLCLIGSRDLLEQFINLFQDDGQQTLDLFITGTKRMGWNVGHFCSYSNSTDCLEYLLKKKYKYVQELSWPAAPFTSFDTPSEPWLLTQQELKVLKDNQFDLDCDHNPNVREDPSSFGSVYPIGVTPLHVAASFGHYDCIDLLLRSGADCTRVAHFDTVDAHDIAICLYSRVKGRSPVDALVFEEKQAERTEAELVKIVDRMHLDPAVQDKLSLLTVRYVLLSVELIMHALIIAFIAVFAASMRSDGDFFSTNALNEGIQKEEYVHELNTSVQTFSDIAEMEELHAWLQGPFYRQIFETSEDGDTMFLTYWHLVGSLQISQLRGTVGCMEEPWYHADDATTKPLLDKCHEDYSSVNQKGPEHISPVTGRSYYFSPENYQGSPYTLTIPNNKTIAKEMLSNLEVSQTFDSNTRAVIIWVNAYNPSVSSFSITTVLIEMPLHGMLYPYWKNRCVPVRNLDWDASEWAFMVVFYIYSACYILYHIVSELIDLVQTNPITDSKANSLPDGYTDIKSLNCLNWRSLADSPPVKLLSAVYLHTLKRLYIYLSREWNFIDLASLVSHLVLAVAHFEYIVITSDVLNELDLYPLFSSDGRPESSHFYETLTPLRDLRNSQLVALAFCIILYCLKLLKYITLFPSVGPVISALVNTCTSKNVFIFIFVWQFLVTAFSIGGHYIVFGEYIYNYRSLTEVFYSIQRHVLSDFDRFTDFQNGHTIAGPFFWLVSTYICHLLLLNLFIAVISVDYSDNLNHAESSWAWKIIEKYVTDLRWKNWFLSTKFFCRRLRGHKKVEEHTETWTVIWPGVLKAD
eukprot:TRINITY_DN5705_c0_g1_i1.p1 TRINITY_DN5705_c0_g1~~TRINITY_DN5705_c0_g1_i1.p1  ORF type:complete len:1998 (+),score=309.77 TRINITY_DN5705_c0_g1_i1:886-5994(+)